MLAGENLQDVTAELKGANYDIFHTTLAENEYGVLAVSGTSAIMQVPLRMMLWNQMDRCMVQLMGDEAIPQKGKHAYDKYMDSIELLGYIDHTKRCWHADAR